MLIAGNFKTVQVEELVIIRETDCFTARQL